MSAPHASTASTEPLASLPKLGVGVLFNAALPPFLRDNLDVLDYLAIIPDRFWIDEGAGAEKRYTPIEDTVRQLDWMAERRPIVGHSVGLSIGSAEIFDTEHVRQIREWQSRYGFPWHSDHLSFLRVKGKDAHSDFAGLPIAVPYDEEVLELVAERVEHMQREVPVPFLLENNVYYVELPEQEMSETEFLNRLMRRTGCGLLLDLHNVYTNSVNHGFDAREFIFSLDTDRVVEVHVAGGSELAGMYSDSHSGPVAGPVWELLDELLPHAPNLCGVTWEFDESYYPRMLEEGTRAELLKAREIWERHR